MTYTIFTLFHWVISKKIASLIEEKEDKYTDCAAKVLFYALVLLSLVSGGIVATVYLLLPQFNVTVRALIALAIVLPTLILIGLMIHSFYLVNREVAAYEISKKQALINISIASCSGIGAFLLMMANYDDPT